MSDTMVRRVGIWLQGLIGGFIGGGAAAATTGITVPALDAHGDFAVASEAWFKLVAAAFIINGMFGAMLWLKQHPVPEIVVSDSSTGPVPNGGN